MKGLLIKDTRLLFNNGKTMILMLAAVLLILAATGAGGASFITSYITILVSLFTVSTISYDEFDHCYLFLMTLPVTRRGYVNEKYVFGFLTTTAAWILGLAVGAAVRTAHGGMPQPLEWIGEGTVFLMMAWIFLSVLIPVRLKFEAEKARYVNVILMIVCCALIFAVLRIAEHAPEFIVQRGAAFLEGLGNGGFLLLGAAATAAVVGISYGCSRHIMERKEF